MQHPLLRPSRALLVLVSLGAGGQVWATPQAPLAIVGEATMVIGMARVLGSDGSQRTLERGTPIRVGDRIETPEGGHVLLRFVDGGRLSVRPTSRLHIESYSHSAEQPQQGAIKFRLDEGVVRSITGAWGEAARERFRLNTPVAAIGVKGTDFVVRSHADMTAASVYTGAITVAPLSGECGASVGPCTNGQEKILTADMKGQMLELARSQMAPVLVAMAHRLHPALPVHLATSAVPEAGAGSTTVASALSVSTATSTPVASRVAADAAPETANPQSLTNESLGASIAAYVPPPPQAPAAAPAPVPVPAPAPDPVPRPPTVVPVPTPEPEQPPVVIGPPQVQQLTWVRYSWIHKPSSDTFTRFLTYALAQGLEKVVGNASYTLYRPPGGSSLVAANPAEPIVNFRLAEATAHLARGLGVPSEAVDVHNARLTVDFSRSTFGTSLDLSNPRIGQQNINASGNVLPSGLLQATSGNATLAGAITTDGREAGYAFQKPMGFNMLQGVTLWGR